MTVIIFLGYIGWGAPQGTVHCFFSGKTASYFLLTKSSTGISFVSQIFLFALPKANCSWIAKN
jgi:hypothetical protein